LDNIIYLDRNNILSKWIRRKSINRFMDINDAIHILQDYIHDHFREKRFAYNLDKYIIKLSHDICKEHEDLAHLKRQNVRTVLREKCKSEVFKTVIECIIRR
jgi:hypothetical protein